MSNDFVQRLDAAWKDIQVSLTAYLGRQHVSSADASDIIQQTYEQIRNLDPASDIGTLEGYAIIVAQNLLKHGHRLRFRHIGLDQS